MTENILTKKEFAREMKVHLNTVSHWISKGMPCIRLGTRMIRIERDKAKEWIEEQSKQNARLE